MDSSTLKSHSPYKRGADWGAWFGIYLSVLFFCYVIFGKQSCLRLDRTAYDYWSASMYILHVA